MIRATARPEKETEPALRAFAVTARDVEEGAKYLSVMEANLESLRDALNFPGEE